MRLIFFIIILATACSSNDFDTQTSELPDINNTIKHLENSSIPLPDFINEVTTELNSAPYKVCIKFNNGLLGQYSDEQTTLMKNHSVLYINMRKQESLEYYENMTSLSDGEGKRFDTGISQICSKVSDKESEEDFLVYFELSFPRNHKYVHIWTVNKR